MVKYWIIMAGDGGRFWDTWKNEEIITVGWDIGDLRNFDWNNLEDIASKVETHYSHHTRDFGYAARTLGRFGGFLKDGMEVGDMVIVRGRGILDIAEITGELEYVPSGIPDSNEHTYWRKVKYLGLVGHYLKIK